MRTNYPFKITTTPDQADPARRYVIVAELGELVAYSSLFEDYGFDGDGLGWREHIETILEEYQPGLLDHIEFAEDSHSFLAYADTPFTVRQFLDWVLPCFGDLSKLRRYLNQPVAEAYCFDYFAQSLFSHN